MIYIFKEYINGQKYIKIMFGITNNQEMPQ
jgi:hypothetical protein